MQDVTITLDYNDFVNRADAISDIARKALAEVRERDCCEPNDKVREAFAEAAVKCAWVRHRIIQDALNDELDNDSIEALTLLDLMLEDLSSELGAAMRNARKQVRQALRREVKAQTPEPAAKEA